MKIEVDLNKYKKITPSKMKTAIYRALNHSASKALTAANKSVREKWNIKAKDLKEYEKIKKANKNNLSVILDIKSSSISLYKFSARQTKKGVSYRIRKDKPRQRLRHAFITKTRRGVIGVFSRKTKKRYPIMLHKSITPTTMFEKDGLKTFKKVLAESYNSRFNHEIDFIIR